MLEQGQALAQRHDDAPIVATFVYVNWNGSLDVEATRQVDFGQPHPTDIVGHFKDWSTFCASRFVPTPAPLYVTCNSLWLREPVAAVEGVTSCASN